MQVVKVKLQTHLLQASGVRSNRSDYGEAEQQDWSSSSVKSYKGTNIWDE